MKVKNREDTWKFLTSQLEKDSKNLTLAMFDTFSALWNSRDKSHHERAQILGNHNSPLCDVDLNVSYGFHGVNSYKLDCNLKIF